MSSGYSGTPLGKKLGLKPGFSIMTFNVPEEYYQLIPDWPEDITLLSTFTPFSCDLIHIFCSDLKSLIDSYQKFKPCIKKDGMMWISWPKKSSKIKSDLSSSIVRSHILDNGLVDVKVASINDTWSGLKAVYRVKDR